MTANREVLIRQGVWASPDPTHARGGYPTGVPRQLIPVEIVQRAFHESGLSVRGLARRLKRHHSSVGRVVRGWAAKQYTPNAEGEVVRYEARRLSLSRELATEYLAAMGYEPAEVRERLDA